MGFLEDIKKGNALSVAKSLNGGLNPNLGFAGVYPIHLAIEKESLTMVALLLNWGVDIDKVDHNHETAIANAKARKLDKIVKLLEDDKKELLPKLMEQIKESLAEEQKVVLAKNRGELVFQFFFLMLLCATVVIFAHALIMYYPDVAANVMPKALKEKLIEVSPILKNFQEEAAKKAKSAFTEQQRENDAWSADDSGDASAHGGEL